MPRTNPTQIAALPSTSILNLAKQVQQAAINTQVTLSVGQIAQLSPQVRAEFRNYASTNQGNPFPGEARLAEDSANRTPDVQDELNMSTDTATTFAADDIPMHPTNRRFNTSIARTAALINGYQQTVVIDTGCSGSMMGVLAARRCNLTSSVDEDAAAGRAFKVANGEVDRPLGIIRDVQVGLGDVTTTVDFTVCRAETPDILLGCQFLRQVDGVVQFNPPRLTMRDTRLQRCAVPLDFSGDSHLHAALMVEELVDEGQSSPHSSLDSGIELESLKTDDEEDHSLSGEELPQSVKETPVDMDRFLREAPSKGLDLCSALEDVHLQTTEAAFRENDTARVDLQATEAALRDFTGNAQGRRDPSDWMLDRDTFKHLNAKHGPFEIDACADKWGDNAQLKEWWSLEDGTPEAPGCLSKDWAGRSIYCNPDFAQINDVLQHHRQCFQRAPATTKVLFVLPDWPTAKWFKWLWRDQDFKLVAYYPAGAQLFTAPGRNRYRPRVDLGLTRWGTMVVLHCQGKAQIPLVPSPATGYWPPVPPPTSPVRFGRLPEETTGGLHTEDLLATLKIPGEAIHLAGLITEHKDVFAASSADLGHYNRSEHHIDTGSSPPLKAKPRRYSPGDRNAMAKEVTNLLEAGVIRPSQSPWSSNPLLVPKPDHTVRMCVDYRPLNQVTVGDAYPMPRCEDIFDGIGEARLFSKIDLKSGFHQIPVNPRDIPKTAFSTPHGTFEYIKMPFGLKNAPATFQRAMDQVLVGATSTFVKVYMDDLLVYSQTEGDHFTHLQLVLQALRAAGLKASPTKCAFAQTETTYLGHLITSAGIAPSADKVTAVSRLDPPTDVTQLRAFLGLTGYYRRFVKGYANIAVPLTALLKKENHFEWTPARQEAFEVLKATIVEHAVLKRPDFTRPFSIQVDWSGTALGAVLSQEDQGTERPVAFQSKTLNAAERNYSATEGEALAAVWGVSVFRPYVHGQRFTLITDCSALTWLKEHPSPPPKLARWLLKLSEFDFDIVHRSGKQNRAADALSRLPCVAQSSEPGIMDRPLLPGEHFTAYMWEELPDLPDYEDFPQAADNSPPAGASEGPWVADDVACLRCLDTGRPEQMLVCEGCVATAHIDCLDPPLKGVPTEEWFCPHCLSEGEANFPSKDILDDTPVLTLLHTGQLDVPQGDNAARIRKRAKNYEAANGVLYKRATAKAARREIPPKEDRTNKIAQCHEQSGHFGVRRTESLLKLSYTWCNMRADIDNHIKNCLECTKFQAQFNIDPELHPIPVEPSVWHTVGMDLMGPFPTSSAGKRFVIVAIDYFSKWIEAKPLYGQSAEEAARFLTELLDRFGAMSRVRTDQGRHFQGAFAQVLQDNLVDHQQSRPYHPQTNGLVERSIETVSGALKRTVGDKGAHVENTWDMKLPAILRGYNMSDQASARFSPFYLHHGWQPKPPVNTTMIPLITAGTSTPATAPGLAPTNRLSTTDGHSPAASSLSEALRLRNRQAEIALANTKRKAASDNIARAQKAQEVDFNRRRNLPPFGTGASPAVNFKLGDLV